MAIELHHLNTHGMMEQTCDVLDGVVRLKERIAELEKLNHDLCERVTENDEIRLHWEEIEQTRAENERMKVRIAELEEEHRWRKFPDEKPSEEMEGEDFIVSNGYYSVVCEWRGYWNNEPFCGDKNCDVVKYWKPLTQAPKEEK